MTDSERKIHAAAAGHTAGEGSGKPRRTFLQDVPARTPEVRPDDVVRPRTPDDPPLEREDRLNQEQLDDELEEGLEDTFPASDPPSIISPKRPRD